MNFQAQESNPFARPGEPPPLEINSGDDILEIREPTGAATGRGVDLVFVIDTTGSMSDKIESLLATCSRFVEDFNALRLNHRIAIVSFGDLRVPGDRIQNTAFTADVEVTKKSLRHIPRNSGGGNEGESSLEALERALSLPFRSDAVKAPRCSQRRECSTSGCYWRWVSCFWALPRFLSRPEIR